MSEKFANGSLVTYRVRDSFVPKTPAQIKVLAEAHGMPASLCPEYAGDRAMAGRAIQSQIGTARAQGWQVTRLDTGKDKLTYTIAQIAKDTERERTDFYHESTVKWSGEHGNGHHIEGWHDVAVAMDKEYQALRGMVLASDWTRHIIDYITGPCRGVAFLESGKMYWIPPQGTAQLEALRAMLDAVGIGLVIGEIDAQSHGDVQEVAQQGLNEQLEALRVKVQGPEGKPEEGFDGTQTPRAYRNTLDELREWRATALAYKAAIGVKLDDVMAIERMIETQVRDLLSVRVATVIHKDGTQERLDRPSVEAQLVEFARIAALDEPGRAQALLDGSVALDCDAHDVDLLAQELEAASQPDQAILDALEEMPDMDPALAAMLSEPAQASDLPTTW